MRKFARLLLLLTSLLWLVGIVPPDAVAGSCSADMHEHGCCAAEPDCKMDCCRVPGNLYDTAIPVASTLSIIPAEPVSWRAPQLSAILVPEQIAAAELPTRFVVPAALPQRIYILNCALLR
jgi:hypothetical protein